MADKTWSEMDGIEKAWEVAKVAGGLALAALGLLAMLSGKGPTIRLGRGPGTGSTFGGGSVWTVGHGGKKGYGTWNSFRHG